MLIRFDCEECGKSGSRRYARDKVPTHFFCSVPCQNKWQKNRQDIVEKNKSPEFRSKVSEGLKLRKKNLGNNYHSSETKKKIGAATAERWLNYSNGTRAKMIRILQDNAMAKRTYGNYDSRWNALSIRLRKGGVCHRFGKHDDLAVHHIVPLSCGGMTSPENLVVLCSSCHKTTEHKTRILYEIIPDWSVIQLLVKERLHCL